MKIRNFFLHAGFLLTILIIVFLPVYLKTASAPKNTFFTKVHGIFQDYYLDLSIIKQGRSQWEEINQYTTEEVAPSRVHLFYLTLGKVGNFTQLSEIELYYSGVYLSLLLFYLFSFLLIRIVLDKKYLWWGMGLVFFASPFPFTIGANWWTYMDIYNRLALRPHHYFSTAMLVAGTYFLILFAQKRQYRFLTGTFIATTAAILFSGTPGLILVSAVGIILALTLIWRFLFHKDILGKRMIGGLSLLILFSLPSIFFIQRQASAGFIGQVISNWGYQNFRPEVYPYIFSVYILSYGLLPIFAFLAVPAIFKKISFEKILISFLAFLPLFFYLLSVVGILPINKIRFVYSAPYVFAAILAIWGIEFLLGKIKNKFLRKMSIGCLIIIFLINAIIGLTSYWWPQLFEKNYYDNIYLSQDMVKALDYLKKNSRPYSNVLSSFYDGVCIPAFTFNKVYLGNETSTYQFYKKWEEADKFFAGSMKVEEAKELFREHKIEHVFWDKRELPKIYQNLVKPVYTNEEITIYQTLN